MEPMTQVRYGTEQLLKVDFDKGHCKVEKKNVIPEKRSGVMGLSTND